MKKSNSVKMIQDALLNSGIEGVTMEADGKDMVLRVSGAFQEYLNFKQLLETHKETDIKIIKTNIRRLLKKNDMKSSQLADILDLGVQGAYGYTNLANKGKPEFTNLLLLSKYFGIEIEEFYIEREDDIHDSN